MNPGKLQLHGVFVDDQQAPPITDKYCRPRRNRKIRAYRFEELTRRNRLDQQSRESGVSGPRLFEPAEKTGERDDRQLRPSREGPKMPNELEPVHVGQNQILQYQVG
jgi:hypothetical protein